jgi:hypothetical protein
MISEQFMLKEVFQLKNKLVEQNIKGIALDIDETLSWTIGLWVERMQKKFGNPERLSVRELIKKYRYTQNVPYWQTDEAHEWMVENMNSNDIQKEIPLIEGVDKYVQQLNRIIPVVAYITVRPDSVAAGTREWLNKHKFPNATLISRPRFVTKNEGNAWKSDVLYFLQDEILGIVDDNIGLVEQMRDDYKGIIFLYSHDKVEFENSFKAIPCKSWKDVIANVEVEMRN